MARFPSKQELEGLTEQRANPKVEFEPVELDRWSIETPIPDPAAGYPEESAWDRALLHAVAGKEARPSPALRCAAQESARVFVEHGGYPDHGLQRYLVARCGATLGGVGLSAVSSEVPNEVTEERIEQDLAASVRKMLDEAVPDGPGQIGLGYARGNGKAGFVALFGEEQGTLDAFSPRVSGDRVELSGTVPRDVSVALGLITQGAYGVRTCEPDRRLRPPRFRISCPVAPEDELASIEIATQKPEQVLTTLTRHVMVHRSDGAGLAYEPVLYGAASSASGPREFQRQLLSVLNQVRQQAGQRPLTLEPAQSEANRRYSTYFFDALLRSNQTQADWLALGLLAGWDVRGMIRDGGIYWGFVVNSTSPGRWLNYAFESPIGRWVLLEPAMSRIALGVESLGRSGVMAVATTYALFDSSDHRGEEDAVFTELEELRRAHGLPAPRRVQRGPALTSTLEQVGASKQSTDEALNEVLHRISVEQGRSVSGWIVETNDVRNLPVGDILLAPSLEVEVGVTHYRAPGGAWGQYVVVFLAYEQGPPGRSARRGRVTVARSSPFFGPAASH